VKATSSDHRDGEGNRQRERLEELTDDAGHEADRQEYSENRERRRHHRQADFRRAAVRGSPRIGAVLHVAGRCFRARPPRRR
jgi:hypothetical protein